MALGAWLALASYVLLVLIVVPVVVAAIGPWDSSGPLAVALPGLLTLQLLQIVRVGIALQAVPERRRAYLVLIAALVLFNAGTPRAGALGARDSAQVQPEILFVPAYAALATFLIVDARRRRHRGAGPWLDAIVAGGAVACGAGTWLKRPRRHLFPQVHEPHLVLLFAYPLFSIFLITGVIVQAVSGRRAWCLQTGVLLGGLALLGVADSALLRSGALGHSQEDYGYRCTSRPAWSCW